MNDEKEQVTLFRSDDSNILLVDENGYNVYFEYEELTTIVENLYLDITYNGIIENMELNLEKDFANNYLTFFKEENIGEEGNGLRNIDLYNFTEKIEKNFILKDEVYYYQMAGVSFEYVDETKLLKMKDNESKYIWNYYLNTGMKTVMVYQKDQIKDTCWLEKKQINCENNTQFVSKKEFTFFDEKLDKLFNQFLK